jgi:hypothetical protein
MKKALFCLLTGAAMACGSAAFGETNSYVYDAMGRLVAAENNRGETARNVTTYFLDPASNRSKVASAAATASVVPVFRFGKSTGVHFYTVQFMEGVGAKFNIEGPRFNLFRNGGAGYTALYRCYVPHDDHHFMSSDSNCEGYTIDGLMGYVAANPATGLVPLYRFYHAAKIDHLITTDYQEGVSNGYALEATFGYVPS